MDDFAIWGVGELGKMFGASALAAGLRVTPITRAHEPRAVLAALPRSAAVLVAVGEDALPALLDALPSEDRGRVILLQNELWPAIWETRGVTPSLILPWVLQKPGQPRVVAGSSPVYGRFADLLATLCERSALPYERIAEAEVPRALVDKYAFILTINALGVWRDETLGALYEAAPERVRALCEEAVRIGEAITRCRVDVERAHERTCAALLAMRAVPARGRTARARVDRALAHGAAHGLSLPALTACAEQR